MFRKEILDYTEKELKKMTKNIFEEPEELEAIFLYFFGKDGWPFKYLEIGQEIGRGKNWVDERIKKLERDIPRSLSIYGGKAEKILKFLKAYRDLCQKYHEEERKLQRNKKSKS